VRSSGFVAEAGMWRKISEREVGRGLIEWDKQSVIVGPTNGFDSPIGRRRRHIFKMVCGLPQR